MQESYPPDAIAPFAQRLRPLGRILELPNTFVWCCSPIYGPDGRVHVFFSKWDETLGFGAWLNGCHIARAVADRPEGPYELVETVLAPRPGMWDATSCHNPHIQFIDGQYCLFYMGNANARTNTKRVGLATAPTPEGPWTRHDSPLLEAGPAGAWDDHCTTNPAYLRHPSGEHWLYYKSWNTAEYDAAQATNIRGNRKYGVAVSKGDVHGPYERHAANPVIDFSQRGGNQQFEDAYVWHEDGRFRMLARDMGYFDHFAGLYMESDDGVVWSEPKVAYFAADRYSDLGERPERLRRWGRLERPQLLMRDGRPTHLFAALQGGRYETSTAFVLEIATA